jgi:hypothetical protein
MNGLTRDTQPIYATAERCPHIEPPEPETPDADDGQWAAWDDDHPPSADGGNERICLDTQIGEACPDCTEYARENRGLPDDEYVRADCCWCAGAS